MFTNTIIKNTTNYVLQKLKCNYSFTALKTKHNEKKLHFIYSINLMFQ